MLPPQTVPTGSCETTVQTGAPVVQRISPVLHAAPVLHAVPSMQGTHIPDPSQTEPVPQVVPGAATPSSTQVSTRRPPVELRQSMRPRRQLAAGPKVHRPPARHATSSGGAQVNCISVEMSVGARRPSAEGTSVASSSRNWKWSAPTSVGIDTRIRAPTSRLLVGITGAPLGASGRSIHGAAPSPATVSATRTRNRMLVPGGTTEEKLNCPQNGASMPLQVLPS